MSEFLIAVGALAVVGGIWGAGLVMGGDEIKDNIKKGKVAINNELYVCQKQLIKLPPQVYEEK